MNANIILLKNGCIYAKESFTYIVKQQAYLQKASCLPYDSMLILHASELDPTEGSRHTQMHTQTHWYTDPKTNDAAFYYLSFKAFLRYACVPNIIRIQKRTWIKDQEYLVNWPPVFSLKCTCFHKYNFIPSWLYCNGMKSFTKKGESSSFLRDNCSWGRVNHLAILQERWHWLKENKLRFSFRWRKTQAFDK